MESNKNKTYEQHYEERITIPRSAEEIFAYIDNHANLSSHTSESSWMVAGSRMETSIDAGHGQEIGSRIKMSGKIFGIDLSLESPHVKIWETIEDIKLPAIGHYRMSFKIEPENNNSLFRVSVDYNLPATNVWPGWLFDWMYAKQCAKRIIKDKISYFVK